MKSLLKSSSIIFLVIVLALSFSRTKAEGPFKEAEDPFLWLEEVEGQKALDWVRTENDRALKRLTEDPRFEELYQEGLEDLTRTDRLPEVTIIGEHTYDLLQDAEHVRGLWRRTSLQSFLSGEPEWEPVLDIDELAVRDKQSWVFGGAVALHPSYERCMLRLSPGGSDAGVWREFDLKIKDFVPDGFQLPEAKSSVAWLDRDTLLVQAAFDAESSTTSGYGRQLRRWQRGTAYEQAVIIFEVDPDHMGTSPVVIIDGDHKHVLIADAVTIFDRDLYYLDEDGKPNRLPLPAGFTLSGIFKGHAFGRLKNDWSHKGEDFPIGSLVAFDFAAMISDGELPEAELVFAPKPNQAVQSLLGSGFLATGEALYFSLLEDVAGKLVRLTVTPEGWDNEYVPMPPNGSVSVIVADAESNILIARYENFLTPPSLHVVRGSEAPVEFMALDPKMDATNFQTVQHFATSKDGTRIPYFVTHPKGLEMDGTAPLLLGAYGGFGYAMTPAYLGRIFGEGLPFKTMLKAGGSYVLANIRGGAEYGPQWHISGILHNRQRVYDDFHAVAEDLIERGYTSKEYLGIVGASNSGLLMGVAFTQRPDLYKAVLCGVPLLDMRRYHTMLAGASWMAEYGNPDDPETWESIKKYSPYHNLHGDREYPEVFFYTSTKDDRVHPGHARKMAAKMRIQGHPYLYYENIEGGHSAAANLNESAKLNALQTAYLLQLVKPQAQPRIRVTHGVPTGPVSPALYRICEQYDVLAPMRDGVRLAMDLVRPDADGAFPVVLIRTPYDKVSQRGQAQVRDLVRRGYLVAIQDCRGRFNSDGAFDPYRQEHADGFDTVEWIAQQPWCDGNIGMIGGSYVGQTQWYAASGAPRALKAIVPTVSPPGHPFTNEPFYGGAMLLAMLEWTVAMGRRSFQLPGLKGVLTEHKDYFEALPLAAMDDAGGTSSPFWDEWMRHPTYDAFWKSCGYEQYWSKITVPALNLTGWWDMNFIGSPSNFVGMRSHGATREAREGQRLVIGPWPHWINRQRVLSGLDFGPDALVDLNGYILRFFDRWLRGQEENGLDDNARVHVFVLGADQWWETDSWPLPGTRPTPLYLRSGGRANSHRGDGTLSFDAPENEPHDEYLSDPMDPVRLPWSLHEGPVDDRTASARSDVLCYTSEVLTEAVDVVGPVTAVLYASSTATDCDWHVRLVDVHPDGAARFLCHGVLRARFREGYHRTAFLTPNEVTRFEIDMTATGVRFLPGHRIRVEIASSWFPRFDRNPQTGKKNWMTEEAPPVEARQVVRHDRRYPSHVLLPLIPDAPKE